MKATQIIATMKLLSQTIFCSDQFWTETHCRSAITWNVHIVMDHHTVEQDASHLEIAQCSASLFPRPVQNTCTLKKFPADGDQLDSCEGQQLDHGEERQQLDIHQGQHSASQQVCFIISVIQISCPNLLYYRLVCKIIVIKDQQSLVLYEATQSKTLKASILLSCFCLFIFIKATDHIPHPIEACYG